MTQLYTNGLGATLGDTLATCKPLQLSGNAWYVHHTGADAGGTAGRNREEPLATIGQAITNSSANDVIVLLSGHTQTVTAAIAVTKSLVIVGEGSSAGLPTANFTGNGSFNLFEMQAAACELRNVSLNPYTSGGGALIFTDQARLHVRGCYFRLTGTAAGGVSLDATASDCFIENCTFLSEGASSASQPGAGVTISGAVSDLRIRGTVFDGGNFGFSVNALDLSAAAATRVRIEQVSMLRGADYAFHAAMTGFVNIQTSSGGVRGSW